jgi:antitoxin VapB
MMGLNIKHQEAHHLARKLADLTGESLTTAVVEALRERLERIQRERQDEDLVERLLALGKEYAAHMREPYRSMDPNEFLYDERGLPR